MVVLVVCGIIAGINLIPKFIFDAEGKVFLKSDGTVIVAGELGSGFEHVVSNWTDIVDISIGEHHTVGLASDGSVGAVGIGNFSFDQCDVTSWTDIVAISAGLNHTVGLKSNGTVAAVGDNSVNQCDVTDWTDIVAISAGDNHTVGLKSDGTVVAVGAEYSDDGFAEYDLSHWSDIIAISAASDYTVGLKSDGTIVYVSEDVNYECDEYKDEDIVSVIIGE